MDDSLTMQTDSERYSTSDHMSESESDLPSDSEGNNDSDADSKHTVQTGTTTGATKLGASATIDIPETFMATVSIVAPGARAFTVKLDSDDSPQRLIEKIDAAIVSQNITVASSLQMKPFNPETSRFIQPYLKDIKSNQITPAKSSILMIPTIRWINIVLPNFTVLKKEVNASEKVLNLIQFVCSSLGITSPEEFGFVLQDKDVEIQPQYGGLNHVESIPTDELKKFTMVDPKIINQAGIRLSQKVMAIQHQSVRNHHLYKQKLVGFLSLVEQGVPDNGYLYLRHTSPGMSQVFTNSECIRRNMIVHQMVSDFLTGIYHPSTMDRIYYLAGKVLSLRVADLHRDQLDPRVHKNTDELKEALLYLSENGGKRGNKQEDYSFSGSIHDFTPKTNKIASLAKKDPAVTIKLMAKSRKMVLELKKDPTQKVEANLVELEVSPVEISLPSKEVKPAGRKKEMAALVKHPEGQFTFRCYTADYNELTKFIAMPNLMTQCSFSEVQHVDNSAAYSYIRSLIDSNSSDAKAKRDAMINKLRSSLPIKETNVDYKDCMPWAATQENDAVKKNKIFAQFCRDYEQFTMLDKSVTNFASTVSFFADYEAQTLFSYVHLMSYFDPSAISQHYLEISQEKKLNKKIKPEMVSFSITWCVDHLEITFINPNPKIFNMVPQRVAVGIKNFRGWKYQHSVFMNIVCDESTVNFDKLMRHVGLKATNNVYSLRIDSKDVSSYVLHQILSECSMQTQRGSNRRNYFAKLENYLSRGSNKYQDRKYVQPDFVTQNMNDMNTSTLTSLPASRRKA